MGPYTRWVAPSFKNIMVEACDDYLETSDRGNNKTCSKLIAHVAKDIVDIAQANGEALPNELEKVIIMFTTINII